MIRPALVPARRARPTAAGLAAVCFAAAAGAQPIFSVDFQGPPKGGLDGCFAFPITEGDLLVPPGPVGLPGFGLAPPFACLWMTAGGGPPTPPGLSLPAAPGAVGLPPGAPGMVELDALSFGTDLPVAPGMPPAAVMWVFSVDEWAMGNPGMPLPPNVASLSPPLGGPTNVSASLFRDISLGSGPACALLVPPGGNTIILDGNGAPAPAPAVPGVGITEPSAAAPGVPDAGGNLDAADIDTIPGPPGAVGLAVYFSLDSGPAVFDAFEGFPGTGSAAANGFGSGANIMVVPPGPPAPAVVWAPGFALGLDLAGIDTDDLDALILWENGTGVFEPPAGPFSWLGGATDMIFFSVRRGSAVIGAISSGPGGCPGLPICEGDILWPPAAPGLPPRIWITAEQLGLMTIRSGFPVNDDLDALDVTYDCNSNGQVDSIETGLGLTPDCNNNRIPDSCDIASGLLPDCNGNGIPDPCEIASGAASDCNGNGIPDSCDIASGIAPDCNGNGLIDMCETHPLTFAPPTYYYSGIIAAETTIAADLNGDGMLDLAYTSPGGGYLGVRLNTGGGTFGAESLFASAGGASYQGLAAGDFDADGDLDLAIANSGAGGGVVIRLNSGAGAFPGTAGPFAVGGVTSYRVAVGNFDPDLDLDLAAVNTADDTLTIYSNTTAAGVISFATAVLATGDIPLEIRAASVDADADPDLVVTNRSSNTLGVYLNAAGTFALAGTYAAGPGPFGMVLADADGDGDLDALYAQIDAGSSGVLYNSGAGVFGGLSSYASVGQEPHAADLDADGDIDLIGTGLSGAAMRALRNTGSGAFPGIGVTFGSGVYATTRSALADLNGDSRPDLAFGTSGGLYVVLGTFAPTSPDCNNNLSPDACDIASGISADANGNGIPDECEPCDPDVNCDGSVNGFDIEATEQAVNGDYSNFCQATADLNNDGAENGFDIETEEQRVNGAPC